jgi:alanine racemase
MSGPTVAEIDLDALRHNLRQLRRMTGGEVLIGGRRAKIAGIVCMDLTMVDVSEVHGVKVKVEAEV